MFSYKFEDVAKAQLLHLPYEAVGDLSEAIASICADPWDFRRSPDEPVGSHYAHRTVAFAEGRGMLTFLILEHAAEVHVTRVIWLG